MTDRMNPNTVRSNKFNKPALPSSLCKESSLSWNNRKIRKLFRSYQRTSDPTIRDAIVIEYLPLVERLAKQYIGKGIAYDDLFQEGCLGLLKAIERFDLSRECQFSTFAFYFIKGQIWGYFRSKAWPCSVPQGYRDMSFRIHKLACSLGRYPTRQEIVEAGCAPADKVNAAMDAARVWEPVPFPYVLHSMGYVDENLETMMSQMTIQSIAQRVLTPAEAHVVYMYYFEEYSQMEIAEQMGTYQTMVWRLLKQGTDKIGIALVADEKQVS